MAVGDTYELTIKATCLGQVIVATHHIRAENSGDLSTTFASQWNTTCKGPWLANLPNSYSLTILACRQINPPGPVGVEFTPTGTITGNGAAAVTSLTAAGVLKWTTAFVGRSRRGRTFVGPLPGDQYTLGQLTGPRVAGLNTYATTILGLWGSAGSAATDGRLVIWSRTIADQVSQNPPPAMGTVSSASAYVTAGSGQAILRTQRRREIGVGS